MLIRSVCVEDGGVRGAGGRQHLLSPTITVRELSCEREYDVHPPPHEKLASRNKTKSGVLKENVSPRLIIDIILDSCPISSASNYPPLYLGPYCRKNPRAVRYEMNGNSQYSTFCTSVSFGHDRVVDPRHEYFTLFHSRKRSQIAKLFWAKTGMPFW